MLKFSAAFAARFYKERSAGHETESRDNRQSPPWEASGAGQDYAFDRVITLTDEEIAHLEECQINPQLPTPSILKAAKLLRELYPETD